MGMIDRFLNVGQTVTAVSNAATGVAEVFTPNSTRRMELDEEAHARALAQHGQEFMVPRQGWFDGFVNGLNRLPRPMLAIGTLGLFVYAMVEPIGFGLLAVTTLFTLLVTLGPVRRRVRAQAR